MSAILIKTSLGYIIGRISSPSLPPAERQSITIYDPAEIQLLPIAAPGALQGQTQLGAVIWVSLLHIDKITLVPGAPYMFVYFEDNSTEEMYQQYLSTLKKYQEERKTYVH